MNARQIDYDELRKREARLRASGASPRMRDAADLLGAPEAALVEARRRDGSAVPLHRPDFAEGFGLLLARLGAVGEAMALTRNEHCVQERHGRYGETSFTGASGRLVGEIDLRIDARRWVFAYALTERFKKFARRSVQIFDATGNAVHKVYPTEATDMDAFDALIAEAAHFDAPPAAFAPHASAERDRPDAESDAGALRADRAALEDGDAFEAMAQAHGASREQAMRLGGSEFARPVAASSARLVLDVAAADATPLAIRVGNAGCAQTYAGPVTTIKTTGPWLNVLDPRFNLHLRWDRIAAAWIVRTPSPSGGAHALDLFDADGFRFCRFSGAQEPGASESPAWRALLDRLDAEV
jgi:putative hemin transport protein